ncbi:HEAT repeat domain-containing protein [Lentzea tibetensis]|uniref:HEAT repeat domain-containing protein n=1 Tax=Lentzea tibetensis TaxID=2591470 RepID=UPI001644F776|nr:HEAT repeat domain-containing protein [Lentzea tibetensis]
MEIPTLIERLADPDDWHVVTARLQKLGDAAFDPLVETLASTEDREVAGNAAHAFRGLEVPLGRYVPALTHPHPTVRDHAAYVLQAAGAEALPHAHALLPLLCDEDGDVRRRAGFALEAIGAGVVPLLRELRRTGTVHERRAALVALADVGGPEALDDADRALVERLIRVKLLDEDPEEMHLCGGWYALPTTDQAAVLKAFDLSDAVPVTMRLGAAAWNNDQHASTRDSPHAGCSRVYVSPDFEGWTLVFGRPLDHDGKQVGTRCAELSRAFGAAHWYGMSCGDGWTAWCVAERGEVRRYYDAFASEDQVGEPLPVEEGLMPPHEYPEDDDDRDDCWATTVAAEMSVDIASLAWDVGISGHGLLALTGCGREHGHPRGALEI